MPRASSGEEDPQKLFRLRKSLDARLRNKARERKVTPDLIRKQYVFALFLQRLFVGNVDQWLLLGGNALLIRTGGGRFTQDIDLARTNSWDDPEIVLGELQAAVSSAADFDPFRFDLPAITPHREVDQYGYGTTTAEVKVTVFLGVQTFATFSIDVTSRRHVDGGVDLVPLRAIIDDDRLRELPRVPVVSVENHLADKLCAMYELHVGSSSSTRYRDLADVVRIVQQLPIRADSLSTILERETQRRKMGPITSIRVPGEAWTAEFPVAASSFAEYPAGLRTLEASLNVARACLDEVLSGHRKDGVWDPQKQVWQDF